MDSSANLIDLVDKARSGERTAFDRLAHRYRSRLESLVALRLGRALTRRLDVEDVVQESLLRGFRSINTFEPQGEGSFYRWLAKISENVVLEVKRYHLGSQKASLKKEISLARQFNPHGVGSNEFGAVVAKDQTSPSRYARRDERLSRLEDALEQLKPDYREVILLATIQGMPIKEIATRLGKKPNAVSMLLMRALRQLKEVFGGTESFRLPPRAMNVGGDEGEEESTDVE